MEALHIYWIGLVLTFATCIYFQVRLEGEVTLWDVFISLWTCAMWPVSLPIFVLLWLVFFGGDVKLWTRKQPPAPTEKPPVLLLLPAPKD